MLSPQLLELLPAVAPTSGDDRAVLNSAPSQRYLARRTLEPGPSSWLTCMGLFLSSGCFGLC
jgi:hypothetical protein